MVAHTCNPAVGRQEELELKAVVLGYIMRPYLNETMKQPSLLEKEK